ncbi:MAG: carbohydrate kinase family protein [Catonella sp.]|uniref:carbohydrate kinase family protein n=1 Tax=Catonella sp. TaxID=2382125 RepID=UPI003F9FB5F3
MRTKIIVAGHICLDITPIFLNEEVKNLNDILTPGKLIEVGNADVHTGGCVANTGLALKILGADVTLIGKIGKDEFGEIILSILDKYDVKENMIISEKYSTSYSVVLAILGIDRIFLHNPGAKRHA